MQTNKSKILIIGAGPAGISCAYQLAKHNFSPFIIEKEAVSGGICRTIEYKGFRFDTGGHRFFTKSKTVEGIWKQFLGDDFLFRKRYSRIYFDKKLFAYPIKIFDVFSKIGVFRSFLILVDYFKSQVFYRDREEKNFKDWIIKRFGRRLYKMFFKSYTQKIWGLPCEEISCEWAAQRVKGLSISSIIRNSLLGNRKGKIKTLMDRFYYPKYGAGQMYEAALNYALEKGTSIQYNSIPQKIEIAGNRVESVSLRNGEGKVSRMEVDHLVSSMPFSEIFALLKPSPPSHLLEAAAGLRYRAFLEVCLIVKGDCSYNDQWIYVQDPDIGAARIQIYKNWSPDMADKKSPFINLGVEYFCSKDDSLWVKEDAQVVNLAKQDLLKLEIFKDLEVIDGFVVRIPYAYPVYFRTYKEDVKLLRDYIEKIDNLQVIGRCGMYRYNNMDHSLLTGICAALNIVKAAKVYNIWEINEENRYLEAE